MQKFIAVKMWLIKIESEIIKIRSEIQLEGTENSNSKFSFYSISNLMKLS